MYLSTLIFYQMRNKHDQNNVFTFRKICSNIFLNVCKMGSFFVIFTDTTRTRTRLRCNTAKIHEFNVKRLHFMRF
jgi:hypothetical protein